MMHAALAFRTLRRQDCDCLDGLSTAQLSTVRKGVISSILCTDMSKHFIKLGEFKKAADAFGCDVTKWDDRTLALEWLLHSADISSMGRPRATADQWTDRVLEEFFAQGDRERSLGRPISPLCDRNLVARADSQYGFLKFIVLPTFEASSSICDLNVMFNNMQMAYEDYAEQVRQAKEAKAMAEVEQPGGIVATRRTV